MHAKWGIDPNRIGVLGFSAGAHLAAALSTHFDQRLYDPVDAADKLSCRPDFAVIVYPGYLALRTRTLRSTPRSTPPPPRRRSSSCRPRTTRCTSRMRGLLHGSQECQGSRGAAHLCQGGHGYGLRRTENPPGSRPTYGLPVTMWPYLMETWLETIKVLPPSADHPVATSDKAYPPQLSGTVVDTSGVPFALFGYQAVIAGATVQVQSANGTVQRTTQSERTAPSLFLDSRQGFIDSWYRIPVLKPKKSLSPRDHRGAGPAAHLSGSGLREHHHQRAGPGG
jgi:hypothetical protein